MAKNVYFNESDDLNKLEHLIDSLEIDVNSWLKRFNLNRESLVEFENKTTNRPPAARCSTNDDEQKLDDQNLTVYYDCPFNSQHKRISAKNFEKHVNKCRLKQKNYSNVEIVILLFLLFLSINNTMIGSN